MNPVRVVEIAPVVQDRIVIDKNGLFSLSDFLNGRIYFVLNQTVPCRACYLKTEERDAGDQDSRVFIFYPFEFLELFNDRAHILFELKKSIAALEQWENIICPQLEKNEIAPCLFPIGEAPGEK